MSNISTQATLTNINADTLRYIVNLINRGSDWKSVALTCKQLHHLCSTFKGRCALLANHISTLIVLFPNIDWSSVRNYTYSLNVNERAERSLAATTSAGASSALYMYKVTQRCRSDANLDFEALRILEDRTDRNVYVNYSHNPALTWEIVRDNSDKPWDYHAIVRRSIVTWEIANTHHRLARVLQLFLYNPNCTVDIYNQNKDRMGWIKSMKVGFTAPLVVVLANQDIGWNFSKLSACPYISLKEIRDTPHLPWDYRAVVTRDDVTWEFLLANPIIGDPENNLAKCPNITWDIVRATPIKWYYASLSQNPSIPIDVVDRNLDLFSPSLSELDGRLGLKSWRSVLHVLQALRTSFIKGAAYGSAENQAELRRIVGTMCEVLG